MAYFDPARRQYPPVGYCIYCGSSDNLSREHVIPYSLGVSWVLPKSSCESCSRITRDFEGPVTGRMLGNMRKQFGFRSRRKKAVKTVKLRIASQSKTEMREIPIEKSPTIPIMLPIFPAPSFLTGKKPLQDGDIIDLWIWAVDSGEQRQKIDALRDVDTTQISAEYNIPFQQFLRMLAKIGHAAACAHLGPNRVKSILPDYILGKKSDLSQVVGNANEPIKTHEPMHHWCIETGTLRTDWGLWLTIKIELFRFLSAPTYWVVVGPASDRDAASYVGE